MRSSSSLAARAFLAVILMAGFYLLALLIGLGLLFLPVAEFVYAHRITPKLDLICLFSGVAVLWSVFPRLDKFLAPGPRLTAQAQPRLFAELKKVADAMGQSMPVEVYLVSDMNAWVSQRGGLMGFGSRRVMGLGLPLLRALRQSEFRGVLAHEFGHYHGGDTRLGPWVYKTRGAIVRTLRSLTGHNGKGSLIQLPFLWYGKMFLRITNAVSRHQEFLADGLAAQKFGSGPFISGLRTVYGAGVAYNAYWRNECVPLLQAGFQPPLAEGFGRFVQAGSVAQAIRQELDKELAGGKTSPYDTHPPLKARIEAVKPLPAGEIPPNDPPALALLDEVPSLERELIRGLGGAEATRNLQSIPWDQVGERVYVGWWKKLVEANAAALKGITADSLPQRARDPGALGAKCVFASGERPGLPAAPGLAKAVVGAALTLALLNRGGRLNCSPGENVSVALGDRKFEPFGVLDALAKGELTPEAWKDQCALYSLTALDLSQALAPAAAMKLDDSRFMPKA